MDGPAVVFGLFVLEVCDQLMEQPPRRADVRGRDRPAGTSSCPAVDEPFPPSGVVPPAQHPTPLHAPVPCYSPNRCLHSGAQDLIRGARGIEVGRASSCAQGQKFEPQVCLLLFIHTVQLIIISSLPHHMSISFCKSQYVVEMVEIRITFKVTPPVCI